ncbi:MAG TPA: glycosyltransferase family 2 protein [Candidatus Saccharimonadales bacterium]|nr:glycosyltransferase family 2 protein [Candidatus Saccharimonadales bacterium]
MPTIRSGLSVVVPVYNEEKYLAACLDSLMAQTEQADEIIIVDNNSTDNSVEIAKRYPVTIIHEKEQGMTPARNRGFNEAKYEIIARTDADTILPPGWVKRIKKAFLNKDLVALSGPASFYDLPKIVNRTSHSKAISSKFIKSYNTIVRQLLKHDCLYGPNYSIRKTAWNQIKDTVCMDDKKVHEDLDVAIHIAPLGKIAFVNSLMVKTSVRRWKRPEAYIEYLYRGLLSIQRHKPLAMRRRSKLFVKKVMEKAFSFEQLPSDFK